MRIIRSQADFGRSVESRKTVEYLHCIGASQFHATFLNFRRPSYVTTTLDSGIVFYQKNKSDHVMVSPLSLLFISISGLRPFACQKCDSKFAVKAALGRHMLAVHRGMF